MFNRGVWRSLFNDETGAMTVDFVVWLPLFVSLLVIVSDASILYLTQTEMWNVARDTVRRMTTQQIKSETDAQCWAKAKLNLYSYLNYDVEADSTDDINSVRIEVALSDASAFGYFLGPVLGETISARVTMRANPELAALPAGSACAGTGGGNGGGSVKEFKK